MVLQYVGRFGLERAGGRDADGAAAGVGPVEARAGFATGGDKVVVPHFVMGRTQQGEVVQVVVAAAGEFAEVVDFHVEGVGAAGDAASEGVAEHDGAADGAGDGAFQLGGAIGRFGFDPWGSHVDDGAVAEAAFEYRFGDFVKTLRGRCEGDVGFGIVVEDDCVGPRHCIVLQFSRGLMTSA